MVRITRPTTRASFVDKLSAGLSAFRAFKKDSSATSCIGGFDDDLVRDVINSKHPDIYQVICNSPSCHLDMLVLLSALDGVGSYNPIKVNYHG